MPIRLSDIYKDSKTVGFEYDGETVTVEYRHNALTPVMRIKLAAGSDYIRSRRNAHLQPETQKPARHSKKPAPAVQVEAWWQDALAESQEYLSTLAGLLVAWDVLDDDGQPLPVTVEWLEKMPTSFINAVSTAMLMDGLPNPRKGKDLPATLPQTD